MNKQSFFKIIPLVAGILLCLPVFGYGVFSGLAAMIVFGTLPMLLSFVINAVRRNQYDRLYIVVVWGVAVYAVATVCVLKNNTVKPEDVTVSENISIVEIEESEVPAGEIISGNEMVLVTASGTKYHKPDCRFVKGKNCASVSVEDAVSEGLQPCSSCYLK